MKEETLKSNQIFADFMEFGDIGTKKIIYAVILNGKAESYYSLEELKFHESWDWIMSVIEKIDQMGASVIIGRMFCEIKYIDPFNAEKHFEIRISCGVKINAVNGAALEFINWLNSQNK